MGVSLKISLGRCWLCIRCHFPISIVFRPGNACCVTKGIRSFLSERISFSVVVLFFFSLSCSSHLFRTSRKLTKMKKVSFQRKFERKGPKERIFPIGRKEREDSPTGTEEREDAPTKREERDDAPIEGNDREQGQRTNRSPTDLRLKILARRRSTKCLNCNGTGHLAREYPSSRPRAKRNIRNWVQNFLNNLC